MSPNLTQALETCETDVKGAIGRLSGNEELYITCLDMFLRDPTMEALKGAIYAKAWDEAFTAAHALKGLAGNMGFVPLFYATGKLVVAIRMGQIDGIADSLECVDQCYQRTVLAIRDGGERGFHQSIKEDGV